MVPALVKHPRVRITGAADLDPALLERFRRDFGAEAYGSVEELCRSPNVDAIYIATPTHLHTQHAVTALEHRKHIVLEKPMALTLQDADAIIRAAERNGAQLVVGHSHSFETPIRKIREVVRSGELGTLRMMHNWYFNDWMYRPRLPAELDTSLGGGITFRQGSHQFDILRMIGGGMVRSVRAMTGVWDETRPSEGSQAVFLEFEDGVVATAVYSGYDRFFTAEMTYGIGEFGGMVDLTAYGKVRKGARTAGGPEAEIARKKSLAYGSSAPRRPPTPAPHQPFYGLTLVTCDRGDIRQSPDALLVYGEDEKRELPLPTGETGRDAVVQELYDAVVHGRPPAHHGRWGKANLEVCLAVLQSARERREVFLSHQTPTLD
jgi:phthalate 4,5-cis-dihydrodiol dehydrogenase